ncbi:MAG: acyl-CoA desaturase [Candidatus Yanofskybacteria bacterium]|nr:acyl-CoA desaturase [Candidatus Yanofskybacteria bacterium]
MNLRWNNQEFVLEKKFLPHTFIALLVVHALGILGIVLAISWDTSGGLLWYLVGSFGVMYFFSGLGITAGYHRYFTHRGKGFELKSPIKVLFAIMGSLAWEQNLLHWVPMHWIHHANADKEGDPHSPIVGFGESGWERAKGFWWAHIGWLISPYVYPKAMINQFRASLLHQPVVMFQAKTHHLWAFGGVFLPAVIAYQFWGTQGFVLTLLNVGFLRIICVWNATWFINSGTHMWGERPNWLQDFSTNLFLFLFALGEAGHNNHHADPQNPFHGKGWQDPTGCVLRVLCNLGLATIEERRQTRDQISSGAM